MFLCLSRWGEMQLAQHLDFDLATGGRGASVRWRDDGGGAEGHDGAGGPCTVEPGGAPRDGVAGLLVLHAAGPTAKGAVLPEILANLSAAGWPPPAT